MKNIYQKHVNHASSMGNASEKLTYLTAVLRSLLQASVVSSFEITKALAPSDETDLDEMTDRFCKPSDGLPIQILDSLIPIIRGYVDAKFLLGWFEITKGIGEPLSKRLLSWVEFRNGRQGHGVLDSKITDEWAKKTGEIITECLIVLQSVIPRVEEGGVIRLSKTFNSLRIGTPLLVKDHAVVILKVGPKKGIWKLKGQLLSPDNADEFTLELPEDNAFSAKGMRKRSEYALESYVFNKETRSFFHNIPVRQTDTFEGRVDELQKLADWINDEDSRFCLIYGDGGYGKTTLVLEMLNLLLEGQLSFTKKIPDIVSYHTAKMTRWTEAGLTHLTAVTPVIDECLRELMRCFHPVLSQDWYSVSGQKLIDKSVSVLKENKFTRDDVLLVIDNTETLATNSQEVMDLGAFFKTVGKLVGRIIITSRRREFIEATPVLISGLSEPEAVSLMKRLAEEYNAKPILQAGESKLRKVSSQLMRKPILLESLVKYISRSEVGIDAAIDIVFKKSNEDLTQFLYEDAWLRINELQRNVFLVVINVLSPLDQNTVNKACQEVGIQHSEFQSGLEETHFAVLTDYGKSYTLEIVELAKRFFLNQFGKLGEQDKEILKKIASRVDGYAEERVAVERDYRTDRVAEAFRSEYAKAAKVYSDKGEITNAIEMYKLAIEDDPLNSSLHDRFSWFLLNKVNDFSYAKSMSKKAVELDENNCDAIVDLALVHYRLGEIDEGDKYIDTANEKGRPMSFCLLRKAIARYYKARNESELEREYSLLEKSILLLNQADKANTRGGGYDSKNQKDIEKYKELTLRRLRSLRLKSPSLR